MDGNPDPLAELTAEIRLLREALAVHRLALLTISGVTTHNPIDLDALLTPEECAKWLKIAERTLLENARLRRIPAVRVNDRLLRFHPRTILAEMK